MQLNSSTFKGDDFIAKDFATSSGFTGFWAQRQTLAWLILKMFPAERS
jgi:hypothetical protein